VCRPTRALVIVIALAAIACSAANAGSCDPPRYQIMGHVVDPSGRPLADATVRLLLDRISAGQFVKHGPRARLLRTNGSGTYVDLIDCGAARDLTDAPNPCADKPKHLTVSIEADGHRDKLVVFKLKELDVIKDAGGCLVQVPDIRLSAGI
jgi:hypothetical protein